MITDYYNKRLRESVAAGDEDASYPILRALLLIQFYKVLRLALVITISAYFLGVIWYIMVCDLLPPQYDDNGQLVQDTFATSHLNTCKKETNETKMQMLIKVWYYALTTLSTIGFGDMSPVTPQERLIGAFLMMFGVANFSFIMSQFIEILLNYKSLWQVGKHKDLSKWIALLSRFNNGNPLNKDLISKIEDFFDYYW